MWTFRSCRSRPELTRARDAYFVTFNMREGQSFRFGDITVVSEVADIDR
jgi:outer membrane protein insertion porin family